MSKSHAKPICVREPVANLNTQRLLLRKRGSMCAPSPGVKNSLGLIFNRGWVNF
jgi:hypothetical protein